jgi:hypothetical protein
MSDVITFFVCVCVYQRNRQVRSDMRVLTAAVVPTDLTRNFPYALQFVNRRVLQEVSRSSS